VFQSSPSPKAECNGGHLKPADINKLKDDFRDPIITYILRDVHTLAKNSSNPDRERDREPPRVLPITIGSRQNLENQWFVKISITVDAKTKEMFFPRCG
jgi:hypothetical protein